MTTGTLLRLTAAVLLAVLACAPPSRAAQENDAEGSQQAAGEASAEKPSIWKRLFSRQRDPEAEARKAAEREQRERERLERRALGRRGGRELHRALERIRVSPAGKLSSVREDLDALDEGDFTAERLSRLAKHVAQRGMYEEARVLYREVIRLEPDNPIHWINLGTVHRMLGNIGPAVAAFRRALALDPNHPVAHYNLGSAYDAQGDYDAAIEEFLRALTLDPSLGDPRVNPQFANNERQLAVRLLLYQRQSGALGLPLLDPAPAAGGDVSDTR